jgi:hypothetical protein
VRRPLIVVNHRRKVLSDEPECNEAHRQEAQINARHRRKAMNYVTSIIAAATLLASLSPTIGARAAQPVIVAEDGVGAPLTLTGAKQAVTRYLSDSGHRELRAGHAEFNRDGNVAVEIVGIQGIAVGHVLVDGKSGAIANAKTGASLTKKS